MWCVHSCLILASKTSSKLSGTGGLVSYFSGWEKYPVSHLNCPAGTLSQCNDVCSTTSFLGEQSAASPCVLNKHCVGIGPNRNPFFFFNIQVTFFFPPRTLTLGNACDWFVKLKNYRGIHGGNMDCLGNNYCNNIRDGSAVKIMHRSVWKLAVCLLPVLIMNLVFSIV